MKETRPVDRRHNHIKGGPDFKETNRNLEITSLHDMTLKKEIVNLY